MYRLNPDQSARLEKLRQLVSDSVAPQAERTDREAAFPAESLAALGKGGWMGLNLPADGGGMAEGMRLACAALDEIAQHCPSTAMVYLMHLCGCACYAAHPAPAAALIPEAAAGRHLSTLAWSEKGSRSHFWAPTSQAAQTNGKVSLDAQKSFVTSAGSADGYVVSTRSPNSAGPTDTMLYLVLKGEAGAAAEKPWDGLGMRGNGSSPMSFRGDVAAERALCAPGQGFPTMLGVVLPWFALGNAAVSVGIAEAATRIAIGHVTGARLEHLGSPLSDLPTVRARVARMRIETDKARAHLTAALDAVEAGAPNATLMVLESKAQAGDTSLQVTDMAMQACGGAAFGRHLGLERFFRDSRAASVMAPTSDLLHEFIGRAVCGMELF